MSKLTSVFFKSPAHKSRWLKIIQDLGKHDSDGRLDQEYSSALYVLTADLEIWGKSQEYVGHPGIDFEDLLKEEDFSSGYVTLVMLAWNLFNEGRGADSGPTLVNVVDFVLLDESNFLLAIDAIKLRRYRAYLQDFSKESAQ